MGELPEAIWIFGGTRFNQRSRQRFYRLLEQKEQKVFQITATGRPSIQRLIGVCVTLRML
jgi:hypothetical protein